jgi:O-antigen/teichoic acid export membrane protein
LRPARSLLLSAASESSTVALFLLGFLAARLLGPVAFGQYSAAVGLVALFRWAGDLGLGPAASLHAARGRTAAYGPLLGLQLLLSSAAVVSSALAGAVVFPGPTAFVAAVLGVELGARGVQTALRWVLRSQSAYGAEGVALVLERSATLVLGVGALLAGFGVPGLVVSMAGVRLAGVFALWTWAGLRLTPLRPSVDLAAWRRLARAGLPFAWAALCAAVVWPLDAVLLERLHGARAAGLFRAPSRLVEGLVLIPRMATFALLPVLARLRDTEPGRLADLHRRGSRQLLLVGGVAAACGVVEADTVIRLVFGAAYADAAPLARVLFASLPYLLGSALVEAMLAASGRARVLAAVATAGAAIKLILSLLLVPPLGGAGAAVGSLIAPAAAWLLGLRALARCGLPVSVRADVARPAAAAVAVWIALRAMAGRPLPLAVGVAALTLLGAAWLLGLAEDWRRLVPPIGRRHT